MILTLLACSILRSRLALQHVTKCLPPRVAIYKRQEDAYKFLEEYIKDRHVREAMLNEHALPAA